MKKTREYITLAIKAGEKVFDQEKQFIKYGSGKTKALYYNEELNNAIIINVHRGSDTSEAIGYIVGGRFTYLSQVLRNEKNVVVEISKIEGTTSDYVINYDFENPAELLEMKNVHEVIKTFHEKSLPKCGYYSSKCMEVENGKTYGISPESFEAIA